MAGFDPDQRLVLQSSLVRAPGLPRWRSSGLGEADAWLLNGAKCRLSPGGNLKIAPGLPTEKSVTLDLSGASRPVAFATPLASEDLEPRLTFEPASRSSVEGVLLHLDDWLRLERTQFVLGSKITRLGARLRHGIFHVRLGGSLLAVLDFRKGEAGISPQLYPEDVRQAEWQKRSIEADAMPPDFVVCSTAQLAWTYARRTERDMLPPRYRTEEIFFRKVPRVPLRLLNNSQLMLLQELATEPSTRCTLCERTGLTFVQIDYALACLYYAGSITTSPGKAAQPSASRDSHSDSSGPALLSEDVPPTYSEDLTARCVEARHPTRRSEPS